MSFISSDDFVVFDGSVRKQMDQDGYLDARADETVNQKLKNIENLLSHAVSCKLGATCLKKDCHDFKMNLYEQIYGNDNIDDSDMNETSDGNRDSHNKPRDTETSEANNVKAPESYSTQENMIDERCLSEFPSRSIVISNESSMDREETSGATETSNNSSADAKTTSDTAISNNSTPPQATDTAAENDKNMKAAEQLVKGFYCILLVSMILYPPLFWTGMPDLQLLPFAVNTLHNILIVIWTLLSPFDWKNSKSDASKPASGANTSGDTATTNSSTSSQASGTAAANDTNGTEDPTTYEHNVMRTLLTIAVTTMILFAPWLRPGTTELKALVNLFHYIFLIIALLPSAVRKVMEG